MKNFLEFVDNYDLNNPKSLEGFDALKQPAIAAYKKYSLEPNTIDFIGHAMALYLNDDYLPQPAMALIDRVKLYADSMGRYGDSPFLYPIFGLGGIPEGFSRLSAIHGGTYMLRTNADEIMFEGGKVSGIKSGTDKAFAPMVICDPSYVLNIPGRVKKVGQVVRCICLMQHTIPNTKEAHSCQIIIPQKQVGRKSDIYIAYVSNAHGVCPAGFSIAMISTNVETAHPDKEIQLAFQIIGPPKEAFMSVNKNFWELLYCIRLRTSLSQLLMERLTDSSFLKGMTQRATLKLRWTT